MTEVILAAILAASRPYVDVAPGAFARRPVTHVCTSGTVTEVHKEQDGDIHIRVSRKKSFIIAEIIPGLPLVPPTVGQRVKVCGIRRYDDKHRWWELHPVESLKVLQ